MNRTSRSRRRLLSLVLGVAATAALTGCGSARHDMQPDAALPVADGDGRRFPAWAYEMPRSGPAYEAAFARLELMATLPCFCGCGTFDNAHTSLKDCFVQPTGEIDPHAAFCETCQDEAIDGARWADQGVPWPEIYDRIVAAYGDRGPTTERPGAGCGGAVTETSTSCSVSD